MVLDQVVDDQDIADRLRHLLALDLDEAVMHPDIDEGLAVMGADALGDLVLVMGKDQVDTAAVDIEMRTQMLFAHGRALDMPSRAAATPGTVPSRLIRARRLPQDEIAGRFLIGRNLDAGTGQHVLL